MQIAIKMRQRSKIFHKQGMRLRFPEVEPFTWHQTLKPTKFMQIKSNKVKLTFVILTQRVYKTHLNDPIYCFWAYTFNICGLVVGNSKKSHNTKNKNMTEVMSLFSLVFPQGRVLWSTSMVHHPSFLKLCQSTKTFDGAHVRHHRFRDSNLKSRQMNWIPWHLFSQVWSLTINAMR
jgi:hypothetical protein